MSKSYKDLSKQMNEVNREKTRLEARVRELERTGGNAEALLEERENLQKELSDLRDMFNRSNADRAKETSGMTHQIQRDQEELQRREDELLKQMEELERMRAQMEERSRRLIELENILARKDSVVAALKAKVTSALVGFEGNGLTITQKNGKVYVSMEDKLLFKSGSYDIDPKGADAIKELSKVLSNNSDINVMIEGHTDDVPYRGKGDLQDNWDLSVKRATTVIRTLLKGSKINPQRVIAAGHAEYAPVVAEKSTAARQKNRRTDIILTPKLDELLSILETN
jgi:chemotaxis protein MotB